MTDLHSIKPKMTKAEAWEFLLHKSGPLQAFLVIFLLAVGSVFLLPQGWILNLIATADFPWSPYGALLDCVARTDFQDRMLAARFVGGAISASASVGAFIYAFWPLRSVPEAKPLPLRGWVWLGFWLITPFIMVSTRRGDGCVELLQGPGHFVMSLVVVCLAAVMIHFTLLNLKRI